MSGTSGAAPAELRFAEPGARWRSLLLGPALGVVGAGLEAVDGLPVHGLGWSLGAALVLALQLLQVRAARTHTSVALTATSLRQGTEVLDLAHVDRVHGADPDGRAGWQLSRALGGAPTVPRGRTGVGLRLRDGTDVQAWARADDALRDALLGSVGSGAGGGVADRRGQALAAPDDDHTPGLEHWGRDHDAG